MLSKLDTALKLSIFLLLQQYYLLYYQPLLMCSLNSLLLQQYLHLYHF